MSSPLTPTSASKVDEITIDLPAFEEKLFEDDDLMGYLPWFTTRHSMFFTAFILILLTAPFWTIPMAESKPEIPLFLTLAWYFFVSWLCGRVCVAMHGPPVIGYLISGFCLQFISTQTWLTARSYVQLLAFLIVLTRAGLEISPQDITRTTLSLGILPVLTEVFAITGFSIVYLNLNFMPSLMLGFIMCCIGDGLVLPKLQEYRPLNLGNLPRIMFTAAPLEVVTVLFGFGLAQGFAEPSNEPLSSLILLGLFGKFVGTVLFAFVVAFLFAQLSRNRSNFSINGRFIFSGTDKEELLFLLSAVLLTYTLCDSNPVIIWDGYSSASPLLESNMAVIVMTAIYAQFRPIAIHQVEQSLSGLYFLMFFLSIVELWMFGALFLFTTLGSNIQISSFQHGFKFIPVMIVGFAARLVCVFIITSRMRHNRDSSWKKVAYETLFIWISSLPRATIQGAICHIPTISNLFDAKTNLDLLNGGVFVYASLTSFIYIGRLAICAPLGSLILDAFGIPLLQAIHEINLMKEKELLLESDVIKPVDGAPLMDHTVSASAEEIVDNESDEWRFRDRQVVKLRNAITSIIVSELDPDVMTPIFLETPSRFETGPKNVSYLAPTHSYETAHSYEAAISNKSFDPKHTPVGPEILNSNKRKSLILNATGLKIGSPMKPGLTRIASMNSPFRPNLSRATAINALGVPAAINFRRQLSGTSSVPVSPTSGVQSIGDSNVPVSEVATIRHSRFPDAINHGFQVGNELEHHPKLIRLARTHSIIPH